MTLSSLSNRMPLMGPSVLPQIARRKTNDNPLMTRRPANRPVGSRIPQVASVAPARAPITTPVPVENFNPNEWTAYKLVTTKKSLLAEQRFHVMRLHPKKYVQVQDPTDRSGSRTIGTPRKVDITNPEEFKRPIRLHRRDPAAPLGGVMETKAAKLIIKEVDIDIEKEKQDALMTEKARIKAEQLSKIAPYGGAREKKKMAFLKKTQQVHRVIDPENKRIRYEEELPWFVEDYDNTNTWMGQREHAMSGGTFMMLHFDPTIGTFNMIPVEKWYKFTEIKQSHKLTEKEIEAAEKKRKAARALPSWLKVEKQEFVETEELTTAEQHAYNKNARMAITKKIFTTKGQSNKNNAMDEEIDYNEERFDDDDVGAIAFFGDGDEDEEGLKAIEARLKKEQLSANAFDIRTEFDYEDEIKEKTKLEGLAKEHGKRVTKALKKREGNYIYDSDSDRNPYASSEESEDEDETFRKSELKKKEEAAKEAAKEETIKKLEAKKEEAIKKHESKEVAKKQKELVNRVKKRKRTEDSSARPVIVAAPHNFVTHAASGFTENIAGDTITDASVVSKKRVRSPTPPQQRGNVKKRRQDEGFGSTSTTGDILEVPGSVWERKRHLGPNGSPRIPGGKVSDNKGKNYGSNNNKLEIPTEIKENKNKRKSFGGTSESDQARKNKRQKPSTPVESTPTPLAPSSQQTAPIPAISITDEEIIALLRANSEGISIKSVANAFKSRLRTGTKDVATLAGRLKQFGKADKNKVFKLKEEFV